MKPGKRKQKISLGEREESSVNVFRLVLALASMSLVCFLLYALLKPYIQQPEPEVRIVPYQSPVAAATDLPTFTPAPPQETPTPAPTPSAATRPVTQGEAITADTAAFVSQMTDLAGHSNAVSSVAYSPDATFLASGSQDGTVRLWNAANGIQLDVLNSNSNRVNSVAFSADGRLLAAGGNDNRVRVWDMVSGESRDLSGPTAAVRSVAFSPHGTTLAAASDDMRIYLWDAAQGQAIATLDGHSSYVTSVAFSPDGSLLASGSADGSLRLWRVPSGEEAGIIQPGTNVTGVAFSPDGSLLASIGADHIVRLWSVDSREQVKTFRDHTENVNTVTFSPDGSLIASGAGGIDDNTVRLWDLDSGAELKVLQPGVPVNSIAFSPTGRQLAVGGGANYLAVWGVVAPPQNVVPAVPEATPGETAAPAGQGGETGAVAGSTCEVTARYDDVNLREGPGTDFEAVRALAIDETVQVNGWAFDANGFVWWHVVDGEGAWVRADTVKWPQSCQELPAIQQ